jgi:UDP-N-acetylglucosamine/UDP-N-acetylgalactosamine diphosphorylase
MRAVESQITKLLEAHGQKHIQHEIESLPEADKLQLIEDIEAIDFSTLKLQKQCLVEAPPVYEKDRLRPISTVDTAGEKAYQEAGEELIHNGRTLCLTVAGGEGSRLNHSGPKGTYPITRVKQKSLFQFTAEKIIAAGLRYGRKLPWAIMTSPKNHQATLSFFQKNSYFGLSADQIAFFEQKNLPYLDSEGKLFLDGPVSIAKGPNGNGHALFDLLDAASCTKLFTDEIEYINFTLVDNPLADPFDAGLFGYHALQQNCVTVKCTQKRSPEEKVGVLACYEDQLRVIEYSELAESLAEQAMMDSFSCANLSLFCFSLSFAKKLYNKAANKLPLHKAWKKATFLDDTGNAVKPEVPNAWKFEYFIFDLLPFAERASCLSYPRATCFSPLKNLTGQDSIQTLQKDLLTFDREVLKTITGKEVSNIPFELSPKFYYPTLDLLNKWQNKELTEDKTYIEP